MATGSEGVHSPLPPSDDEDVEDFHGRGSRSRRRGQGVPAGGTDEEEQFRMFQRFLESQRRPRTRNGDESDGDAGHEGRGSAGPPPEWDGQGTFEDYLIRAKLWIATTKTKAVARGPLLLKALKGAPFESFKYLAKDASWLASPTNAEELLNKMDAPDQYGEDREEHLLSSLSRITFHLKRSKQETWREFFSRWEVALRKVKEHKVKLPEPYLGFLLIHGLRLEDQEIRAMLNFTQGDIQPKSIKAWLRKHESKLTVNQLGTETGKKNTNAVMLNEIEEDDTLDTDEDIGEIENLLAELHGDQQGRDSMTEEDVISESEAAEILATMLEKKKKKTFYQSMKAKKNQELSRGYGGRTQNSIRFGRNPGRNGESGGGRGLSIQEIKLRTRCGICKKVGHWHRECPSKDDVKGEKEAHHLSRDPGSGTSSEVHFCGMLETGNNLDGIKDKASIDFILQNQFLTTDGYQDYRLANEIYQETAKDDNKKASSSRDPEGPENAGPHDMFSPSQPTGRHEDNFDTSKFGAYMSDAADLFFFENWMVETCKKHSKCIHEDSCATLDTGCQRLAIGMDTLRKMTRFIPEGLQIQLINSVNRFRSVHGTSTTHRLAVIPSSLGHKGSILRPAIFEDEHGKDAPFLLSLPLLLHGGSTIYLDSNSGLFLKLGDKGERIACHLGPTGALRVPVLQFTSTKINCLIRDFEVLNRTEFDVLTTSLECGANFASASVAGSYNEQAQYASSSSIASRRHGGSYEATAQPECVSCPDRVAQASAQVVGPHHEPDTTTRASTTTRRRHDGGQLSGGHQSMEPDLPSSRTNSQFLQRIQPDTERHHLCHQAECAQPDPPRASVRSTRAGGTDGTSTQMLLRSGEQALHEFHGGCQPREGILALPKDPREPMQVLPVARVPTDARSGSMEVLGGRRGTTTVAETGDPEDDPEQVSTCSHLETGIEPTQGEGDLPHLRKGDPCDRSPAKGASGQEGDQAERKHWPVKPVDQRGDEPVPAVSPLAEIPAKLQRQVKSSLRRAISFWKTIQELFSFHGVDDVATTRKLQSLHEEIVSDLKAHPRGTKRVQQIAEAMHLSVRNLKTVAEIYNPGCFSKFAKQHGLEPGVAFDISLGHDLLCPQKRSHVIEYIKTVRPGLTLISPPCHMYSQLQNLLKELREQDPNAMKRYLEKKRKASTLLNFAVEIAELCRKLDLTFVLEHPWSAQSWQTKVLESLIQHKDVLSVVLTSVSLDSRTTVANFTGREQDLQQTTYKSHRFSINIAQENIHMITSLEATSHGSLKFILMHFYTQFFEHTAGESTNKFMP